MTPSIAMEWSGEAGLAEACQGAVGHGAATQGRERSVSCAWCKAPNVWTLNGVCVSERCQRLEADLTKLRPCRGCGRPINGPRRWCSPACHRSTEGPPADDAPIDELS